MRPGDSGTNKETRSRVSVRVGQRIATRGLGCGCPQPLYDYRFQKGGSHRVWKQRTDAPLLTTGLDAGDAVWGDSQWLL